MRNLLLALMLTAAPVAAQAQGFGGMFPGPGTPHTVGGGGYVGPGDVSGWSTAASWSGLRAYSNSTAAAGANAVQVCTAADALCTNIRVTSTGGLSAADITTSTCTGTACTIKTWYDQTGNGKAYTQATISARAMFHVSCISALPCADFNGTTAFYHVTGYGISQPLSINIAVIHPNVPDFSQLFGDDQPITATAATTFFFDPTPSAGMIASSGQLNLSPPFSTWEGFTSVFNGASSIFDINGSQTTGTVGAGGITDAQLSGYGNSASRQLTGSVFEFGIWASAKNGTQISALNANQHAYGIF